MTRAKFLLSCFAVPKRFVSAWRKRRKSTKMASTESLRGASEAESDASFVVRKELDACRVSLCDKVLGGFYGLPDNPLL